MKHPKLKSIITFATILTSFSSINPCVTYAAQWVLNRQGWSYNTSEGAATGWQYINGKWYHFNENGIMSTNWLKDSNDWYYLKSSGDMATGWQYINNHWYLFNPSGQMLTGWVQSDKDWYPLSNSGAMSTGWVNENNKRFFMNSSGAMVTGTVKVDDKIYHFDNYGAMTTGKTMINGTEYEFDGNGQLIGNTQPPLSNTFTQNGETTLNTSTDSNSALNNNGLSAYSQDNAAAQNNNGDADVTDISDTSNTSESNSSSSSHHTNHHSSNSNNNSSNGSGSSGNSGAGILQLPGQSGTDQNPTQSDNAQGGNTHQGGSSQGQLPEQGGTTQNPTQSGPSQDGNAQDDSSVTTGPSVTVTTGPSVSVVLSHLEGHSPLHPDNTDGYITGLYPDFTYEYNPSSDTDDSHITRVGPDITEIRNLAPGTYIFRIVSDSNNNETAQVIINTYQESNNIPDYLQSSSPTSLNAHDGKITGLHGDITYEYKLSTDSDYTQVESGKTEITGLHHGTYLVRIVSDSNDNTPVSINVGLTSVNASDSDSHDGKIIGLSSNIRYEYKPYIAPHKANDSNDTATEDNAPYTQVNAEKNEITGLAPGTYLVRIASDSDSNNNTPLYVDVRNNFPALLNRNLLGPSYASWRDGFLGIDNYADGKNGADLLKEFTADDMKNSVLNEDITSDNRLKNVMQKVRNGNKITIAYIGGSITHGYSSSTPTNSNGFDGFPCSYASISAGWWKNKFGTNNVNVVNIGIPASDSIFAIQRMNQQLKDINPDLIILEFNANDGYELGTMCESAYTSLIKRCLTLNDNKAAVISLVLSTKDDFNAPDHREPEYPITNSSNNFHYNSSLNCNIPIISYKHMLYKHYNGEIDNMPWNTLTSTDYVHPLNTGHMLLASVLTNYYDKVFEEIMNVNPAQTFTDYSDSNDPLGYLKDSDLYTLKNIDPDNITISDNIQPVQCESDIINNQKIHIVSTLPYWNVTTNSDNTNSDYINIHSDDDITNLTKDTYERYFDEIKQFGPTATLTVKNIKAKQIILYAYIMRDDNDTTTKTYGTFEVYVDNNPVPVAQKVVKPGDGIAFNTPRIVDTETRFIVNQDTKVNKYLLTNGGSYDNSFIYNKTDLNLENHTVTIKCYGDCKNLRFVGFGVSGLTDSQS